jgi:hypothetical protein
MICISFGSAISYGMVELVRRFKMSEQKIKVSLRSIRSAGLIPQSVLFVFVTTIMLSGAIRLLEENLGISFHPWAMGGISAAVVVPLTFVYLERKLNGNQI